MCGRYKIEERWLEYSKLAHFDWNDPPYPTENPFKVHSDEVFPRNRMPIVRFNDEGKLVAELRQWGFIMMINCKSVDPDGKPKKIRRDVFNAMNEKLTSSFTWKWSKERRCLIPMSSWDEWPETGARKQRVRVSMPAKPVFMAAGLMMRTSIRRLARRWTSTRCAPCRRTSSSAPSTTACRWSCRRISKTHSDSAGRRHCPL